MLLLCACAAKKQPYPPETQTPATTDTQSKLLSEELLEPEPPDASGEEPSEPQEPVTDDSEDGTGNDLAEDSPDASDGTNQPSDVPAPLPGVVDIGGDTIETGTTDTPDPTPDPTPEPTPDQTPDPTPDPVDEEPKTDDSKDILDVLDKLGKADEPEKPEKSGTGWLIAFLAAALVAAAEGVYIWLHNRRSKKRRRPQPEKEPVITTLLPRTADIPQKTVQTGPVGRVAVGKVHAQGARESQQDSFSVSSDSLQPDGILAVVADGMGGLADGDRVSQTIVSAVMHTFVSSGNAAPRLPELLAKAKYAVDQLLGQDGLRRSGSTIVMGLIRDGMFDYLSVGDSRICLYRDGELQQLNRSHSYSHELSIEAINGEKTFEEIRKDRRAECLTSYVGMGELKYVDIPAAPIKVHPGDVFILMSDGVFNALKNQELSAALEQNAERAAELIDQWIQEKHYRNQDNYTAVILQCCADAAE